MPIASTARLALSTRFLVSIDKYELESFTQASGLEVSWDVCEYRAGDNDNERWISPGLTKYPNVKLSRAAEKDGSALVRTWLNSNSFKYEAQAATISLLDAEGTTVTEWTLRNIMPVKWSIAPFDASNSKVAIETLELAHTGFLDELKA